MWNVMYETLTEISRISLFIQAAPFPKVRQVLFFFVFRLITIFQSATMPALEPEATVGAAVLQSSLATASVPAGATIDAKMDPGEIVERVFNVRLTAEELREFRIITLTPNSPLYEKGSRAVALWIVLGGELDLPDEMQRRVNGARVVGEMGLLSTFSVFALSVLVSHSFWWLQLGRIERATSTR